MRILLGRHAQTIGNLDDAAYAVHGDENMPITDLGWRQAQHQGRFLRELYSNTGTKKWPTIYMSLYLRTRQTLGGVMSGMGPDLFPAKPKLRHDARLIEKHFGATNFLDNHGGILSNEFTQNMKALSHMVYTRDPYTTPNILGESSKETLGFVKSFIDGTLARAISKGSDDFLFLIHGAVIKDFLMTWFHVPLYERGKIDDTGNCDIIEISGDFTTQKWTAIKIYDGEKMEPANINVLRNAQCFTIDDLPQVPGHLKVDF
jgi:2,3-bisphosphoglycerate-dependent phosphoglycerate mutase